MKFYISVLTILLFAIASFAQETKTDKSDQKPKSRAVLRFAQPEQMLQLLNGKWIFADMTCAESYSVTVSSDQKSIKFKYAKPQKWSDGKERESFTYNVIEVGDYYIRTQMKEETRKTADGKTVMWDFMFLSADEFVWHRTDWKGLNSTTSVTRCKDEKTRSVAIK